MGEINSNHVGTGGLKQRSYATSDPKMWNTLKERAREHRNNPTEAEEILWKAIRNNQLGCKFRRQQAIHVYIADFVCLDLKLIIEVDGGYHEEENQRYIDEQRTHDLNALGYRVVRFTNEEVLNNLPSVIQQLQSYITEAKVPRPNGEGDLGGGAKFDYIMGNPPFVGYTYQTKDQKDDILSIYIDENGKPYKAAGKIDYVSCWYFKAAQMMQGTNTRTAFVSTNSITQGEQVAAIWKPLYDRFGVCINFAYRTFRWDSEASLKAHVHCVIVGFNTGEACVTPAKQYTIYDNERVISVNRINPYLINAENAWIESRKDPICDVPHMTTGNRPADGGHLIIEGNDYDEFVRREPQAKQYIKRLIGSEEFINNKTRYCLWLVGVSPAELRKMPEVLKRIEACRQDRLSSPDIGRQKLADTPHLFRETQNPEHFMVIPKVSSENRRYIPIGFFDNNTISTDLNFIIPNASLYHLGVLESNVHMAWMRAVCGRLKSDYRYSKDIVYNNFPWPDIGPIPQPPSPKGQGANETSPYGGDLEGAGGQGFRGGAYRKIEQTAQAILDARALYPDSSLADLYDEVTMPPELRKAHQNNDRAVMEAYGFDWRTMTESECVAELFKLYQQLVERDKENEGEKKGKGKRGKKNA